MSRRTPRGMRLHVGILGRRNVGKSSLVNALTNQTVSIVSEQAGTTTDPVWKPMELLPLGPILLIDTAGVDDEGALGRLRVERTHRLLDRLDVALLVTDGGSWGEYEERLLAELRRRSVPLIVVMNKSDLSPPGEALPRELAERGLTVVRTAATRGGGVEELRLALLDLSPLEALQPRPIIADLIGDDQVAVLVIPVDKEAPKGRLILPQAQCIRDLLDHGRTCMVVREKELASALRSLARPPALVVTDSQAFEVVARTTPQSVPLTSFSILFARLKGDLGELVRGTRAIARLRPGARVLVAEACSHHPVEDDIGREKIPRWLRARVGGELRFDFVRGHDFPDDLAGVDLVIQCGSCMMNRREVLSRILGCRRQGVPFSNYGLAIAECHGLLERATAPFERRGAFGALRTRPDAVLGAGRERAHGS